MLSEEKWEPTPRWHWRYWMGYRWRLWTNRGLEVYEPPAFRYQTDQQRAHEALEETYGRA